MVRCTLVDEAGGVVGQWTVDDVGVTGDPTAVSGAPEEIVLLDVEYIAEGGTDSCQVTAAGMYDPLGLSGTARGVEDEEQVFGIHHLCATGVRLLWNHIVPPVVSVLLPLDLVAGTLQDQHAVDGFLADQRVIDILFERDDASATPGAVLGDHCFAGTVVDPISQTVCAESTKDHRMGRSDAGTSEHRHDDLRHHSHVDGDGIPFGHPHLLETVGTAAHLRQKILVAEGAGISRLTLPVECDSIRVGRDMSVEARLGHIERAADKPAVEGCLAVVEYLVPGSAPEQLLRFLDPESLGVCSGLLVDLGARIGIPRERLGRRE